MHKCQARIPSKLTPTSLYAKNKDEVSVVVEIIDNLLQQKGRIKIVACTIYTYLFFLIHTLSFSAGK